MIAVIVLASGQGTRLGAPKQWVDVGGRPLVSYSVETFEKHPLIDGIFMGVDSGSLRVAEQVLATWAPSKGQGVFIGGDRRQDTAFAGLSLLDERWCLVGIHDAARPLVSLPLVSRVVEKALECGSAVPALFLRDTVKMVEEDRVEATLDRERLRTVQTPQFFKREIIVSAYEKARLVDMEVTDDAALVENLGMEVRVVEGEERNFKVTYPQDLESLRRMMGLDVRVGFGYDVHAFVEGGILVLGGVKIPFNRGLLGHSDADVLSHAVCDALLGAAGLGDLGRYFPDSDDTYKGVSGVKFLERVADMLSEKGWEIVNVDATLVLEVPRIAPYAEEMIRRMSRSLRIEACRVNVKATTTERLGFAGREEGIAAYAVAILKRR
jgi:2-C-methyl-D-erythritol 4-phosphate cytidylyltransferase/2-C-methyl-D-erythritol 2,4-cyclodiphosphate synthase